jgi:hypothetical protein
MNVRAGQACCGVGRVAEPSDWNPEGKTLCAGRGNTGLLPAQRPTTVFRGRQREFAARDSRGGSRAQGLAAAHGTRLSWPGKRGATLVLAMCDKSSEIADQGTRHRLRTSATDSIPVSRTRVIAAKGTNWMPAMCLVGQIWATAISDWRSTELASHDRHSQPQGTGRLRQASPRRAGEPDRPYARLNSCRVAPGLSTGWAVTMQMHLWANDHAASRTGVRSR